MVPIAQIGKKVHLYCWLFLKATYLKKRVYFLLFEKQFIQEQALNSADLWKFSMRLGSHRRMRPISCLQGPRLGVAIVNYKCLWNVFLFNIQSLNVSCFNWLVCHVLWISVLAHTLCIRSARWHQSDSNKQWHQTISLDIFLAVTEWELWD